MNVDRLRFVFLSHTIFNYILKLNLLTIRYNDAILLDLLKSEQQSIAKELGNIEREISMHNMTFDQIAQNLKMALDIVEDCGKAYREGSDTIKKLMNQAIFDRFLIKNGNEDDLSIEGVFKPPFDKLIEPIKDDVCQINKTANNRPSNLSKFVGIAKRHIQEIFGCGVLSLNKSTLFESSSNDDRIFFRSKSLSKELLVEARGVEPLSENKFTGLSPSAVNLLRFPPPGAGLQAQGFGSFMMHDTLKALRIHVRY